MSSSINHHYYILKKKTVLIPKFNVVSTPFKEVLQTGRGKGRTGVQSSVLHANDQEHADE